MTGFEWLPASNFDDLSGRFVIVMRDRNTAYACSQSITLENGAIVGVGEECEVRTGVFSRQERSHRARTEQAKNREQSPSYPKSPELSATSAHLLQPREPMPPPAKEVKPRQDSKKIKNELKSELANEKGNYKHSYFGKKMPHHPTKTIFKEDPPWFRDLERDAELDGTFSRGADLRGKRQRTIKTESHVRDDKEDPSEGSKELKRPRRAASRGMTLPRHAAFDTFPVECRQEPNSISAKSNGRDANPMQHHEWVQCSGCDKWRRLPYGTSAEALPEVWRCDMPPVWTGCREPEDQTLDDELPCDDTAHQDAEDKEVGEVSIAQI